MVQTLYLVQVLYVQVFHGASRTVLRVTPAKYSDKLTPESCHALSVEDVANAKRRKFTQARAFAIFQHAPPEGDPD